MKAKSLITVLALSAIATVSYTQVKEQGKTELPPQEDIKFICSESYESETQQTYPTTIAITDKGKIPAIRWREKNLTSYSTQQACKEFSPNFARVYRHNNLSVLTNTTLKNKPVICAIKEHGETCQDENILITLTPEDNPLKTLVLLKNIFHGEQIGPIYKSGGIRPIYIQIDLEEFLRNTPIENKENEISDRLP